MTEIKYEVRDYTAVFSIEAPVDTADEEWDEMLAYMQDHFNAQWGQTSGSGTGWTVTIHADDRLIKEGT